MIYTQKPRPAIIVDDRLPDIEYFKPEKAEVLAISGEEVTDKDYLPLPGSKALDKQEVSDEH